MNVGIGGLLRAFDGRGHSFRIYAVWMKFIPTVAGRAFIRRAKYLRVLKFDEFGRLGFFVQTGSC